jgi:hypothetical protein
MPPITPLSLLIEIGILLVVALGITWSFGRANTAFEIRGGEAEWLTSSAYMSSQTLHQLGYIPHWEPWLAFGEPLVDNPFSFVTNPLSVGPSLIWGALVGIRVSVILYAILAAIGGWTLGRVMGFGWLARLLLGLLCLGKGNMVAMIGTGYFQLGVTQAYFPWIIAGFIGVLRFKHRRWPIVLTAIMFTLMFWAGNIWYTLPILIMLVLLALVHIVTLNKQGTWRDNLKLTWSWDRQALTRVLICAGLTLGLSMMIFFPIWINQSRIGGHPNEVPGGTKADLGKILYQFVNGDDAPENAAGLEQFYYSFVLPLWFGVLIFIALPPIKWLWQSRMPSGWRVWSVIAFMIVFSIAWGAGGNPLFVFLYNTIPLFGQWRFVGRALAVASFGIAVLAAARVDGLWGVLSWTPAAAANWRSKRLPHIGKPVRRVLMIGLIVASGAAAWQLNARWPFMVVPVDSTQQIDGVCIDWLRQQNPGRQLAVYSQDYYTIYPYLRNNIRAFKITADFHPIPDDGTLYHLSLINSLPEYGLAWEQPLRSFFTQNGYTSMADSPAPVDTFHCLWHKADALTYAYTVPLTTLAALDQNKVMLRLSDTTPLADNAIIRTPDQIGLYVTGLANQPTVATIQELDYPGWKVQLDGVDAHLESIGGQVGVLIPAGATTHTVNFYFQPVALYQGTAITLFFVVLCVLYLLNAERLIPATVRQRAGKQIQTAGQWTVTTAIALVKTLMNSNVFEPKDQMDEDDPSQPAKGNNSMDQSDNPDAVKAPEKLKPPTSNEEDA